MEIDILIPVEADECRHAISTMTSFVTDTDVGVRLCAFMHGSARKHFQELDSFLVGREVKDEHENLKKFDYCIDHEPKKQGNAAIYTKLAELVRNRLSVLVHPGIVVNDPKWFGKMQQTFLKDPRNMACIAMPFENTTLPPLRAMQNQQAHGDIILLGQDSKALLSSVIRGVEEDLRRNIRGLGGNRWTIASVRYIDACPESSEPQATLFE